MPCTIELVRSLPVGASLVRVSGTLDESFDKKALFSVARGVVVLDLDGVTRVTSFGVREWIHAIRDLNASYIGLIRCRPAIVTQLNTVSNFGTRTEVLSMYAPYVTRDGAEFELLIDMVREHKVARSLKAPEASHPRTGEFGELDDEPSSYFSYVAGRQPPAPPPYVEWLLSESNDPEPCRVQSEIVDGVTAIWLSGNLDKRTRLRRIADGLEGEVVVILDGIASISEDGIASLSVLLGAANANFYIARVPERVLPQVKQAAERHEAPIISVLTQRGASEHFEVTYTNVAENEVSGISELVRASLAMPTPEHIARFMNSRLEKTTNGGTRSSPPPPPGASVGKYELLEHIASGGMAQVYLARQRGVADFQKIVAVKRILPHLARTQRFVDMFAQEARLAAKIRHPNVVDIYELEQDDTSLFIAMEYIDGIDARTLMTYHQRRQIHIPMDIALGIVRDVASGLHAAHTAVDETGQALGIVHRDVSPRNILLSVNGAVKLTDFGIAKAYSVVSATAPGMVKGKLPYLAPEQLVAGGPAPGPVSDVFAAGVVLFELLAGVHPFAARTKYEIMKSIVESDRPRVGATRPDVPAVVEAIVQSAIATQPSDRYASAAMLRDALDQAIEKLGLGYTPMRVAAIAELASVQDPNAGDEGSVSESEVDNQPTETYHGAKD